MFAFSPADGRHMVRALRLARRGLYTTAPNPRVGCVIVKGGRVVGEGAHLRAGGPHAEVAALAAAGDDARGATAYVTLEPCAHHGRTPPCAPALAAAGVARVVAATRDPNPAVQGRGFDALRAAGVAVEEGLLADEARALNRGFFARMERALPWIRIKMALSLDGRTAMESGESAWISSAASRRDVQFWRARSDALVTTSATVAHDDPRLDLRLDAADLGIEGEPPQPLRVVIDAGLRTRPDAKIYRRQGRAVVACGADAKAEASFENAGVEVWRFPGRAPAPEALFRRLAEAGVGEAQIEAGARFCGDLIRRGLYNEILIYLAPSLMGSRGKPFAELEHITAMARRVELRYREVARIGEDLRLLLEPRS